MRMIKPNPHRKQGKGQAMVEFAIVFPILIVIILALVEFSFYLKDMLGVQYANLQAARTVAVEGVLPQDDTPALMVISNGGLLSLNFENVDFVEVYKATSSSDDCPAGSTCPIVNGRKTYPANAPTAMTYRWKDNPNPPYGKAWLTDTIGNNNWPPRLRNDVIPTDIAAVRMKYKHFWVDPLLNSINGPNNYVYIEQRAIMPIEPSCYSDDAQYCQAGQ